MGYTVRPQRPSIYGELYELLRLLIDVCCCIDTPTVASTGAYMSADIRTHVFSASQLWVTFSLCNSVNCPCSLRPYVRSQYLFIYFIYVVFYYFAYFCRRSLSGLRKFSRNLILLEIFRIFRKYWIQRGNQYLCCFPLNLPLPLFDKWTIGLAEHWLFAETLLLAKCISSIGQIIKITLSLCQSVSQ